MQSGSLGSTDDADFFRPKLLQGIYLKAPACGNLLMPYGGGGTRDGVTHEVLHFFGLQLQ